MTNPKIRRIGGPKEMKKIESQSVEKQFNTNVIILVLNCMFPLSACLGLEF